MTNVVDRVGFTLSSVQDFATEGLAKRVLGRLMEAPSDLRPVKYSAFEPIDRSIATANLGPVVDLWLNAQANQRNRQAGHEEGHLLLGCKGGAGFQISWQKGAIPFLLLRRRRCRDQTPEE
jgi:hypothetical protein